MISQKRIWAVVCLAGVLWIGAPASGLGDFRRVSESVPGQYIVVFNNRVVDVPAEADALSARHHGDRTYVYQHALEGFAVEEMSEDDAIQLSLEPQVEYVEQDSRVSLPPVEDVQQDSPAPSEADWAPWLYTWGLDRIDQRDLPLNGSYFSALTGFDVKTYVIDTGILSTHVDFGGRVIEGYTPFPPPYPPGVGPTGDCYGHGTHVAGTLGGFRWGVARGVKLVPVKVYEGCSGNNYASDIMAGVEWVTKDHVAGQPAVANISIQVAANDSLDRAVRGSIADGIVYAIAAGNLNGQNACGFSPARVVTALTVAASGPTDVRAKFSNTGPCVDLFAPGEGIKSAWFTSNTATHVMEGTSMSSPHVAGGAALFLQMYPMASPSEVSQALIDTATLNRILDPGPGTPNRLLYRPEWPNSSGSR